MFLDIIKSNFRKNEPIFTGEILELFNDYSRAYVFRLIDKAIKSGELIQFSTGVYYLPKKTVIGISTITAQDVIQKKYLGNRNDVYGIYGGLNLQNVFSLTTQMPNILEIVTNNETMRRRTVVIDGQKFILRKSRCIIDKTNVKAYTVLQLYSDIGCSAQLDRWARAKIMGYIKINNISVSELFALTKVFPAQTTKNLINSGVLE